MPPEEDAKYIKLLAIFVTLVLKSLLDTEEPLLALIAVKALVLVSVIAPFSVLTVGIVAAFALGNVSAYCCPWKPAEVTFPFAKDKLNTASDKEGILLGLNAILINPELFNLAIFLSVDLFLISSFLLAIKVLTSLSVPPNSFLCIFLRGFNILPTVGFNIIPHGVFSENISPVTG